MTTLAGVDGCRAGWYVVAERDGTFGGHVAATFAAVLMLDVGFVAVDIPIGLVDAGARACDLTARRALQPNRGSSVFPAPIRAVLSAASHAEASDIRAHVEGKRVSVQAFHITAKIAEVDRILRGDPAGMARVREVHPEVSFAQMNGGEALADSKKTAAGRTERIDLLAPHFGDAPARLLADRPKAAVAADDVLDAFAALWTARRVAAGTAHSLPEAPPHDRHGLPMAIWV